MKILYILTCVGVGGAQVEVVAMADRLKTMGHEVKFIAMTETPAKAECVITHSVTRLYMKKTPWSFLQALWKARSLTRSFKPDVVHTHMFHANIFGRALRMITPLPRLICTAHNTVEGGMSVTLAYRYSDWLADLTTNVSQLSTQHYIDIKAAPAAKIRTIYNGIEMEHFRMREGDRKQTRRELNVGSKFVWLAIGRLADQKDYPNLLRAFAILNRRKRDSVLLIAGAGDQAKLRSLSNELGINGNLVFLGVRSDVPALLNAADALVLSSSLEGLPMVVVEAMASKTPVVSTDAGGLDELVRGRGLIVPIRDSEKLGQAMIQMEDLSSQEREQIAATAQEYVHANFSLESVVADWVKIYKGNLGLTSC